MTSRARGAAHTIEQSFDFDSGNLLGQQRETQIVKLISGLSIRRALGCAVGASSGITTRVGKSS